MVEKGLMQKTIVIATLRKNLYNVYKISWDTPFLADWHDTKFDLEILKKNILGISWI